MMGVLFIFGIIVGFILGKVAECLFNRFKPKSPVAQGLLLGAPYACLSFAVIVLSLLGVI